MTVQVATLAIIALASFTGISHAQDYPNRTVTITVGFTADGPTDAVARILADQLSQLTPVGNSSEQATAYLRSETEKWSRH